MDEHHNVDGAPETFLFKVGSYAVAIFAGVWTGVRAFFPHAIEKGVTDQERNRVVMGLPPFRDIRGEMLREFFAKGSFGLVRRFGSSFIDDLDTFAQFNSMEQSRIENMVAVAYLRTAGSHDATVAEDLNHADMLLSNAESASLPQKIQLSILGNRQAVAIKKGNLGEAERLVRVSFAIDEHDEDAMVHDLCIASLRRNEDLIASKLQVLLTNHPKFGDADSPLHSDPDLEWLRSQPVYSTMMRTSAASPAAPVAVVGTTLFILALAGMLSLYLMYGAVPLDLSQMIGCLLSQTSGG